MGWDGECNEERRKHSTGGRACAKALRHKEGEEGKPVSVLQCTQREHNNGAVRKGEAGPEGRS